MASAGSQSATFDTATSPSASGAHILNIQLETNLTAARTYKEAVSTASVPKTHTVEPEMYVPKDSSSLNRADLDEVSRYKNLLWAYQRSQLEMVKRKIELHPQRYSHNDYLETATFLILSDWPSAQQLCFCGIPSRIKKDGCSMHQFCPYCCWKVRTDAQLRYVPKFHDGTWHWLNGSFHGDLPFSGADGYDWLHYWNAHEYAFRKLLKAGLIQGAYWTEELAVNSLLPTRVLPHIHAIVDAYEFTDTTAEAFEGYVAEYLEGHLEGEALNSDVKVKGVLDQKSLLTRIGYMNKPMKLLRAYQQAWPRISSHNRSRAWQLNSQLTDLIKGHSQITRRRTKMKYIGSLRSNDNAFIGVTTDDLRRAEHQQLINELKKQPTEFIDYVAEEECEKYAAVC